MPAKPALASGLSLALSCVVLASWSVGIALAQETAAPAHIAFTEGSSSLDHEGQTQPATAGLPFVPGDRLRTAAGRVEILFPDGSVLEVDEYSTVELQSSSLLRLIGGRLMLIVAGAGSPADAVRFRIDTAVASANTDGPGEYRVSLLSGDAGVEAELAVLRGSASIRTEQGSLSVRAGERSLARDLEAPSPPQAFNSARFDAFDRWSALRRDARMGTAQSAQYLPPDLQMYGGTFDRYGTWQYEAPYGNVWYPAMSPGWRPYYNGYWSPSRHYGWIWIGLDPWGWPTHHYGRWGFNRSRWFWIPEHRWAPAWVTWAAAPGYVSWCPIGFDNHAVFALSVNVGNPWLGWVAVPRTHFGHSGYVQRRYTVAQPTVAAPFVVQATAPVPVPHATPRAGTAAFAGDLAVPRTPGRDTAVPRGGAAQLAAGGPVTGAANQRPSARRESFMRVPRSGVAQEVGGGRVNPSTASIRQPFGRSSSVEFKQPLAQPGEVRRAHQRNAGMVSRREIGATSRAVDRSLSRQTYPSFGQTSPSYGAVRRAAPPPAATSAGGAISSPNPAGFPTHRRFGGAPGPTMQPQPQQSPIRTAPGTSAVRRGSPSAGQQAQPVTPAPFRQSGPHTAAARPPGAVPRGFTPSAPRSDAVPRSAGPAQAAPRSPSSRRPS